MPRIRTATDSADDDQAGTDASAATVNTTDVNDNANAKAMDDREIRQLL